MRKDIKLEVCYLFLSLMSVAGSKPQGDIKLAYSDFAGIPSAVACKKGTGRRVEKDNQ